MTMTRPIGIDEVLEERRVLRQEKQERIAARRAEIIARLSPGLSCSRWRETALALRHAIAAARKAAGLTQAEAGLLVGVSQRTYRDYEAAKTDMPSAKVVQLAALLGVAVTVGAGANGQNSAHSERPAEAVYVDHGVDISPTVQAVLAGRAIQVIRPDPRRPQVRDELERRRVAAERRRAAEDATQAHELITLSEPGEGGWRGRFQDWFEARADHEDEDYLALLAMFSVSALDLPTA